VRSPAAPERARQLHGEEPRRPRRDEPGGLERVARADEVGRDAQHRLARARQGRGVGARGLDEAEALGRSCTPREARGLERRHRAAGQPPEEHGRVVHRHRTALGTALAAQRTARPLRGRPLGDERLQHRADAGEPLTGDVLRQVDDVRAGDAAASAAAREAGRSLGAVRAGCVNLLNPSVIVVGGSLVGAGEHLLAGAREVVYRRSLPLATQHLRIVTSRPGGTAGVLGASTMVIDHVLGGDALEQLIQDPAARTASTP